MDTPSMLARAFALTGVLMLTAAGASPAADRVPAPAERTAPLFTNLGDHHLAITTDIPLAQRYFDQGLVLAYGFNHAEAQRSFLEAARLDPACAMCWWGAALVLGPNINKPMDPQDSSEALRFVQRAGEQAHRATPLERDLIRALAARYSEASADARTRLDQAYAEAMATVAERHGRNADVLALYAEALMTTMPWDYWVDPATPRPATRQVLAALERALEFAPRHPGANHLYIHAVEASATPERAESAADTLDGLIPGAGHLVHMPSHIYIRVGRYADASRVNEKAAAADEAYISQCRAQGFYPAAYYPHNIHFLWASASMEGRRAVATAAARKLVGVIPAETVMALPELEELMPTLLYAYERFGDWESVLESPLPPVEQRFTTALWHYAQGRAHAARGEVMSARSHRDALRASVADDSQRSLVLFSGATRGQIMDIALATLEAALADARGEAEERIRHLREAVALQDALPYSEPSPWYRSARQELGEALLAAGHPSAAEVAFREDLAINRDNGWSLAGLVRSLRLQQRGAEAEAAEAAFRKAWRDADHPLEI